MPPSPSPPPRDPYQILGIARAATPAEIAAAYRALVRALHPDALDEPADPARLAKVLAAYALLRNPHHRATYDRQHPVAAPPPEPGSTSIPVRVHPTRPRRPPDIRVGPVRHHPE
ncbi:DnaJ domain-containing protein [Amycolatopsis panacis]|uniref:J domain-containing protein n=1 Tax=Amycolatopsis panacis TaxID=2340917 RepID=A0A419I4R6_9PSEU|nr:DnaJ domain-containing protein [Amycolatopsis panacis]RJQ85495.1 J domain-containing protein [Amycolatopsis panacis]